MIDALARFPRQTFAWMGAPTVGSHQIDAIKYLALLLMVIDHLSFLPQLSQSAVDILTLIGRPVFPMFAFVVVYHFVHHTRNKSAYLLRMLIFAFIAEGPYQQMIGVRVDASWYTANILFSLALGIVTLLWIEWLIKFPEVPFFRARKEQNILPAKWLVAFFGACALFVVSMFVSYLFFGTIMMIAFYLWLTFPGMGTNKAAVAFTFALNLPGSIAQAFAGLLFFPIMVVMNIFGEQSMGWVPRPNRWFFYAFYPLHLVLIIALGVYL